MAESQETYRPEEKEEPDLTTPQYAHGGSLLGLSPQDLVRVRGAEAQRILRFAMAQNNKLADEKALLAQKLEDLQSEAAELNNHIVVLRERLQTARSLLQLAPSGIRLRSLTQIIGSLLVGLSPWTYEVFGQPGTQGFSGALPYVLVVLGLGLVLIPFLTASNPAKILPEGGPEEGSTE